MIWIVIFILAVVVDQVSKAVIIDKIPFGGHNEIIDGFFYIANIRNKGAAWSMFQNGRYFFIVVGIAVSIVMAYYVYKSDSKFLSTSLTLVIGGAIGNIIDRIFRGSVVDFLEFHFGSYTYPIFNLADCFVVVGTILLAYYLLFVYKEKPVEEEKEVEGQNE